MTANHQRRINIVGGPGSGKTTLSRILAEQLGLQRIELDAMNHMAGWKEKDRDLFRAELATALEVDGWVVDGNYAAKGQDLVWETADTVIWLDLPRRVVFPALIARTVRRGLIRHRRGRCEERGHVRAVRRGHVLERHGRRRRRQVQRMPAG